MKTKSLSKQWNGLHWFWKLVYCLMFLSMPWTLLFVLCGFWHLDDRLEEVSEKIDTIPMQTISALDTIQPYEKRW